MKGQSLSVRRSDISRVVGKANAEEGAVVVIVVVAAAVRRSHQLCCNQNHVQQLWGINDDVDELTQNERVLSVALKIHIAVI